MKNSLSLILFFITFFLLSYNASAQHKGAGFGVKGGLNYNTSGKYFQDAKSIWENPGASTGYHAGVFYKFGGYDLYLRPELIFTDTKFDSGLGKVAIQRLDAPVMVGMHLFKVASIMAGPSFHYTLSDNFSNLLEENNDRLRFGYQFGLGLNFGPVGLDLRYEREFNDQKISFDRVISGSKDFKSEQVVLGLSFQF
jgi:hypothetical protein